MRIGIIIQARQNSSRFPNKVLYEFERGVTIIDILYKKLVKLELPIIFAIPDTKDNDELSKYVNQRGFLYYRGSENNVLERMVGAAEKYEIDSVVRVCADNIFLQQEYVKDIIEAGKNNKYDYIAHYIDDRPSIMTHYGFFAELVKLDTLKYVLYNSNSDKDLEHVTYFIHQNPQKFNILKLNFPEILKIHKNIRLTLDTQDDLDNINFLLKLCGNNYNILVEDMVEIISQNEKLNKKMIKEINKNIK